MVGGAASDLRADVVWGLVAAVLFAITACRGFFGRAVLPTDSPLPYFAYPSLVLALAGWIWTLMRDQ